VHITVHSFHTQYSTERLW